MTIEIHDLEQRVSCRDRLAQGHGNVPHDPVNRRIKGDWRDSPFLDVGRKPIQNRFSFASNFQTGFGERKLSFRIIHRPLAAHTISLKLFRCGSSAICAAVTCSVNC